MIHINFRVTVLMVQIIIRKQKFKKSLWSLLMFWHKSNYKEWDSDQLRILAVIVKSQL